MSYNIIKINRGDSFELKTQIPESITKNYILNAYNIFYFALMSPHQSFEDAIIKKGCTSTSVDEISGEYDQDRKTGIITIKLTPQETKHLTPGIYYYTTKLVTVANCKSDEEKARCTCDDFIEVRTIIERTKFIVNE